MRDDRTAAHRVAAELEEPVREAGLLARKLGLDPYRVNYWVVTNDEMNQLIAYDGFQSRYPHWRWGMKYDRQRKQSQFGMGKAFEIVNNDDPANAFLQESNSLADQKAVITHVEAHADFFANNQWFGLFLDGRDRRDESAPGTQVQRADDDTETETDHDRPRGPNAAAMLERHAETIADYADDPEIGRETVERFVDTVSTLTDTIDQHRPYSESVETSDAVDPDDLRDRLDAMEISEDVRGQVFDEAWLEERAEAEAAAQLDEPRGNVLAFLREHGMTYDEETDRAVEMPDWQRETLEILRREAYYFAGQRVTKVMNEGWACVDPETPVFTPDGLVPMRAVVEESLPVSDGEAVRDVYDSHVVEDHDTVTVETRRGFELTGSNDHRVRRPDGTWVRLDELSEGDEIAVSGGNGVWPAEYVRPTWTAPEYTTLDDVAEEAGVSVETVIRYRDVGRAREAAAIESALRSYDGHETSQPVRTRISVPDEVTEQFGRFLGLLVGDGHVSERSGQVGFTTAERGHAEEFAGLVTELFGIDATVAQQGSRWRVYVYARNLVAFLTDGIGLPSGNAADRKTVPEAVLRSPKSVVAEFVRGLFDADGYAGDQGVILSTKSDSLSSRVQLLLANFGILCRRRQQADGCYHVHITGASADTFAEAVGFGYPEKAERLRTYLDGLAWSETETWTDEVTSVSEGTGTVYDISVDETHRYAGGGFVNHNSYWESLMMGEERFAGTDEFLTYADHQARVLGSPGLNPYKLGKELWEYVENTANRREVIERLLRVEGVTPTNFHDVVDFDEVEELLDPHPAVAGAGPDVLEELAEMAADGDPRVDPEGVDRALSGSIDAAAYPWKLLTHEGLVERHFSLAKPQYRGFLRQVGRSELEEAARYLFDDARYETVPEAIADVDRGVGWARMREVCESHNDVTFVDAFLTEEFVRDNNYFTYEFARSSGDYRVTSAEYEDVKRKLLLQFTNFGKPTVSVYDGNFANRSELLLGHEYNGVSLDTEQAKRVLERVYELWGRPVNLATVVKEYDEHDLEIARRRNREPSPREVGRRIRYDGETFETHDLDDEIEARIAASEVDYDTKPEEWLD